MSGSSISIPAHEEPLACPRCGTAWRLKRELCVSCLLAPGLETDVLNGKALDDVLDQIDTSDATDARAIIQINEEIRRRLP